MRFRLSAALIALAALIVLPALASEPTAYVGNVYGDAGKYRVFEFNAQGNPARPVDGGNLAGTAWPSAIKDGNTVHVFASDLTGSGWTQIRRFSSVNGAAYSDNGVVLAADGTEPYGIGPATVTHDGTTWRMYYLVRGASGPGSTVKLATSSDGVNWSRQGVIYTAGNEAPGGLSVSYACTDGDDSYLFLHAYASGLGTGDSILASASDPDGAYSYTQTLFENTGTGGTVSGSAGNNFAAFTGTVVEGTPIVINHGDPQPYIVTQVVGSYVYLDRPLATSPSGAGFAGIFSNKADISFVRKTANGWVGAMTGYGQFTSVISEYTAPISASSLLGTWTAGFGYFLMPYFNSGKDTTENPEPIRSSADC